MPLKPSKLPPPAYLGYRAGAAFARALPKPLTGPLGGVGGSIAAAAMADRRFIVERNLDRSMGRPVRGSEQRRLVGEVFDCYTRYWIESFRLPGTSPRDLEKYMTVECGLDEVLEARRKGTGAIFALPHLGGWEWAAFWMAAVHHAPVTAVVEPVEPPELADWFLGLRSAMGVNVVPLGPHAGSAVAKALKDNHVVCLVSDRDIAGNGIEVEFFGEKTTLPGGPATLALRTGAPLLSGGILYDGEQHVAVARPMDTERRPGSKLGDEIQRVTQALAHDFEAIIRRAPTQWHLMQPNWPSDHEALAARHRAR